jgi:hypothetical protein
MFMLPAIEDGTDPFLKITPGYFFLVSIPFPAGFGWSIAGNVELS